LHRRRRTNSGSPVSDRWTRPDAHEYRVQIPSRREDDAGRTRTATSDAPAHCRSSLAHSRRSNETIRSRDTQYRQNTLENPGGLARRRWLPSKSSWAHAYAQQAQGNAMFPLQPDPPSPAPVWICPICKSSCAPGPLRSRMARSRLSSFARHAEPKQPKAKRYPINRSTPALT